jgi:hypothetical protein
MTPAHLPSPTASRLSAAQWARYEQVGLEPDLDLDRLRLDWTDPRLHDLGARGALQSINLERTIEGGSTVTLVLRDPDGRLFAGGRTVERQRGMNSTARAALRRQPVAVDEGWDPILAPDVVGRAMEVALDGVTFRLVKVRYSTASQEAELTFEDRIVYWLRRKRGERRAKRGSCTRAEFVLSLLREVHGARGYRFVCPELHVRQPIDAGTKTGAAITRRRAVGGLAAALALGRAASSSASTSSDDDGDQGGGFAANAHFTVAGGPASPEQKRNLSGLLTECAAHKCSHDVMVAAVCCTIQESAAKRIRYGDAAGPDSRGMFQQRAPWGPESVRLDARGSTRLFLLGGRGGQKGYKQANGSLQRVPGGIEAAVKRVQISVGGYAKHESEARKIVRAWGGPSAEGDAAGGGTYTKSYQFTRGADEDSWTAMQRLASEVGWRCFVVGNSVYFMSEADLYARRARYAVAPDDPAVLDLSYDVDWGKPISECSLTVVLDRWGAPPGSVVTLDDFGPPDGRWLVVSVQRDYFSPTAAVTLRQPGKAKLEPANEVVTRASNASSGGDGEGTDPSGSKPERLLQVCRNIHSRSYPYIWGGGHAIVGHPDGGTGGGPRSGPPPGYDCSGSTAAVLGVLGLGVKTGQRGAPIHSSLFGRLPGAQAGRGSIFTVCFNGGHVYIRFEGSGRYERFDTAGWSGDDNSGRGPRLRTGQGPPGDSGFNTCHWKGW